MTINVLMLNYEYPPLGGGTGIACSELLKNLACRDGVRVDLITSGVGPTLTVEDLGSSIRIYRLPVGKRDMYFWRAPELTRWLWQAFWLARKLTRESAYDVCHCWSGWPAGVLGYLLRRRVPYFVSLRGSDVPGYSARTRLLDSMLTRRISQLVWRSATKTVAVSSELRTMALRTTPELSIDVVANGVCTDQFYPGNGSGEFTILFVGRLIERKGGVYLLKAFHELVRQPIERRSRLLIVGDGPERPLLQRYCKENGLDDSVEFLGHVERRALPDLYRQASLFVLPTLAEGMSNALLEALASGLPVVVSRAGAAGLVQDNGFVVTEADAPAVSAAMYRYLSDPALENRHGAASRRIAESMSWSAVTDWYMRTYRNAASHSIDQLLPASSTAQVKRSG